jgi:hypothetical protein
MAALGLATLLLSVLIGLRDDRRPASVTDPSCLWILSQAEAEQEAMLEATSKGFESATVTSSLLLSWSELSEREPGMWERDSPNCVWWVTNVRVQARGQGRGV